MVHVGSGSEGAPYTRLTATVGRSVFGGEIATPGRRPTAAGWEDVSP